MTDSAGATAKSYSYDAYGNILESPGTLDQPYAYTGREFDTESGLYYYRARYYESSSGRFLQQDPIGLAGGLNLYGYVGSNPVNAIDPMGLIAPAVPLVAPVIVPTLQGIGSVATALGGLALAAISVTGGDTRISSFHVEAVGSNDSGLACFDD
ncbi:MAG: RHS repeat-associated core domain-containing protein [Nitrospira sp.]|nr:RHS repeat-associated core domain-containing protein [Nitrospira sp.]MDH4304238.1 RHS repeat-associated core domain-containing protein [Nitrospira sp.]MDH5195410.1 RHS repeat-associated core domain-containing protein [Nitrospira sp.]